MRPPASPSFARGQEYKAKFARPARMDMPRGTTFVIQESFTPRRPREAVLAAVPMEL